MFPWQLKIMLKMAVQNNFLQWNCQSLNNKKHEIIFLLNQFSPVVFAVSETWLRPGSIYRVSGYSCLRDDRTDGYAGCSLFVKRSVSFSQIHLPSHSPGFNIVAARVLNTSFVSVYIPHPSSDIFVELSSILSNLPGPILVLGDFNCRHTLWGSHLCDPVSSFLLDLLEEINLCILNDGSATRRSSPVQNVSIPDLTLSSPSLVGSLSWRVLHHSHGSDHFPILISLLGPPAHPTLSLPPLLKYRIPGANWDDYSSSVHAKIMLLPDVLDSDLLSAYSDFVNSLLRAADETIPLKSSGNLKIPSPAWWDSECSLNVKKRKSAERLFASDMSVSNYINLQRISAHCKRLLKQKKHKGWRSFCESISPRSPASLVWKKIKSFRCSFNDPNINSNNMLWLPDFLNKLAPPFVPSHDCYPTPSSSFSSADKMNGPFSFEEFCCALEHIHDSAPGIDGIPYSFITKAPNSAKKYFLQIINSIFSSGNVPDSWKIQIIIPILKSGKDPSNANSYRPIALSSALAKIMEHLVKNRLEWILENRNLLSRSQFGFRRGLGTTDSLSILTSDIRVAFSKNEHVVGAFLDINAAYDNVNLPILRKKMFELSIPERIINFICNMFMGRSVFVRSLGFPSNSSSRLVWRGLPQGSVLSPLLYSLYTSDLDTTVNCFCKILQYADDIVLYCSSNSFHDAFSRLNSALYYLDFWLSDHGLSLSPSKSSAMVFTRRRRIPDTLELQFQGQTIALCDRVKFLGVILDPKLSGIHHLNYVCQKAERGVNVLRALSGVRWGSHPFNQKILYNAIIRSHFDYGCFLLEPCNKIALAKLDRIQNKCLRIITGSMRSSPSNALQVECLEAPFALRRQLLADRFFLKAISLTSHPLLPILESLSDLIQISNYWLHKTKPLLIISYNKFTHLPSRIHQSYFHPLFESNFESLIFRPNVILNSGIFKNDPGADSKLNEWLQKNWSGWTYVYTDASKLNSSSPLGSAVWIPKFNLILNFKSCSQNSVFSGEAIAILEALSFIESHKINKSLVLSDSLSCLQDIVKSPFRCKNISHLSLNIKQCLHRCHLNGIDVALVWIPGHSGILGNETADFRAKEASLIGMVKYDKCFSHDLRASARSEMLDCWDRLWQRSRLSVGKYYGSIQPHLPVKSWFFKFRNLPKITTSTLIRLRLGHSCTPVFLAKIRVRDHSLCECGLDEGNVDHIFFSCPLLSTSLYDLLPRKIPRPVNAQFLLSLIHLPYVVHMLSNFLNSNNIHL